MTCKRWTELSELVKNAQCTLEHLIDRLYPRDVYRLIGQGTLEELKYERQSTFEWSFIADIPVHKQQRSRQLNDGTFERRIHQGYDGGRTADEQGELFGTHNIFRFNPNGFVSSNVSSESSSPLIIHSSNGSV